MAEIATNRELYRAISQLIAQYDETARPLEEYLRALWGVALRHRQQTFLTPNEFFDVLVEAFSAEPFPFEAELWLENHGDVYALVEDTPGYQGWEYRIARQIIDLLEMAIAGQLANEHRYFGINAPRGSRWYNCDPCAFLECATAGTFGGRNWEDHPDRAGTPLTAISWENFRDFLGAGSGTSEHGPNGVRHGEAQVSPFSFLYTE
jgi:hypothetical protein